MLRASWGAVLKVWVYAAASLVLGAALAPLLYNAGKALAEVSASKSTNGLLEWVAGRCANAGFVEFHQAAVMVAALLCFFPWLEWLHAGRAGKSAVPGPWMLRLPGISGARPSGQPLRSNPRGMANALSGFLLMAGLLLSLGVALVPAGFFSMQRPEDGLLPLAIRLLGLAAVGALLAEVFFRGISQGIFLRAMSPAASIGCSAAFSALVFTFLPQRDVIVPDPDAARAGLDMLEGIATRFADWSYLLHHFVPLLAMGLLLGHARWRSASLWLPWGLQTGWLFANHLLATLAQAKDHATSQADLLRHGLVPFVAILTAATIIHGMTAVPDEHAATNP